MFGNGQTAKGAANGSKPGSQIWALLSDVAWNRISFGLQEVVLTIAKPVIEDDAFVDKPVEVNMFVLDARKPAARIIKTGMMR